MGVLSDYKEYSGKKPVGTFVFLLSICNLRVKASEGLLGVCCSFVN